MPYLETAQSWLTQSTLLLQARPSTTRITSKYTISPPTDPSKPKPASRKSKAAQNPDENPSTPAAATPAGAADPIRASLTLKTYDPASGTTLKYCTTKAAEVSRLIQILGKLARPMAGLPEVKEEIMADAVGAGDGVGSGVVTPVVEGMALGKDAGKTGGQGGAPGKKGKKKGKK